MRQGDVSMGAGRSLRREVLLLGSPDLPVKGDFRGQSWCQAARGQDRLCLCLWSKGKLCRHLKLECELIVSFGITVCLGLGGWKPIVEEAKDCRGRMRETPEDREAGFLVHLTA